MKVTSVMHEGVQWVSPSTSIAEIARIMRDHDIGAVPVGENDKLIGMVTDRDLVCRMLADGRDPRKATARDVMTSGIAYCRAEQELDDALAIMQEKQIRRLPVIDKNKRMVGMLSLGDVSEGAKSQRAGDVLRAVSAHHH